MKKGWLILLVVITVFFCFLFKLSKIYSANVYLKNGNMTQGEWAEENDDLLELKVKGGTIGIDKAKIKRIEMTDRDIYLKRKSQTKKDDIENLLSLVDFCIEKDLSDEAIQTLQGIIKVVPDKARPYYLLGTMHMRKGDTTSAVKEFRMACSCSDSNAYLSKVNDKVSFIYDEASRNYSDGEYREAILIAEEIVENFPNLEIAQRAKNLRFFCIQELFGNLKNDYEEIGKIGKEDVSSKKYRNLIVSLGLFRQNFPDWEEKTGKVKKLRLSCIEKLFEILREEYKKINKYEAEKTKLEAWKKLIVKLGSFKNEFHSWDKISIVEEILQSCLRQKKDSYERCADNYFNNGLKMFYSKKYSDTVKNFSKLSKDFSDSNVFKNREEEIYPLLAISYFQIQKYNLCMEECQRVLNRNPEQKDMENLFLKASFRINNFDEINKYFSKNTENIEAIIKTLQIDYEDELRKVVQPIVMKVLESEPYYARENIVLDKLKLIAVPVLVEQLEKGNYKTKERSIGLLEKILKDKTVPLINQRISAAKSQIEARRKEIVGGIKREKSGIIKVVDRFLGLTKYHVKVCDRDEKIKAGGAEAWEKYLQEVYRDVVYLKGFPPCLLSTLYDLDSYTIDFPRDDLILPDSLDAKTFTVMVKLGLYTKGRISIRGLGYVTVIKYRKEWKVYKFEIEKEGEKESL